MTEKALYGVEKTQL